MVVTTPARDHGPEGLKRAGRDVTIVATSSMVGKSLQAAEELEKEGVSCEVVDPRTLFPLDKETILGSIRKTGRLLITHEAVQRCGWGAEVAALAAREAFDYLDAPVERVCAKETPVPFAPNLEKFVIPDKDDFVERSGRNIGRVTVLRVAGLNVYDVLRRPKLLLTRASVEAIGARLAGAPGGTEA